MASSQSGAAIAARHRTVELAELLEQPLPPFVGNADAGVGNLEAKARRIAGIGRGKGLQGNPSFGGELDRIAEEIEQNLPQP